jgi:hypothetical protein
VTSSKSPTDRRLHRRRRTTRQILRGVFFVAVAVGVFSLLRGWAG